MLGQSFKTALPLIILVLIPLLMRPEQSQTGNADEILTIITPHNESIRYEFSRAFVDYCREQGREVKIDWRSPGGTSEIVRYINDQFRSSFRRHCLATGAPWNTAVAKAFNNRKLSKEKVGIDSEAWQARQAFLKSDIGIGIDLFFGGGQYEMNNQAKQGHAVDAGLIARHPKLFQDNVVPATFSGERFYDPAGRYYGTCLSAFGICYNVDRLKTLTNPSPPSHWASLGEARFIGQVGVADPTKSGSITKCFEMLIQQQMAEAVAEAADTDAGKRAAMDEGWRRGLNLIKRIGGNARYITDSASKVTHDVGKGNTTVGMCIDFYGRSEADWTAHQSGGVERMRYVTPTGGSSISVDPILLFRGAPNRALAIEFMEFVLSERGQAIWNYRVGTPDGPKQYALRRLPVRRDMYTDKHRQHMSDARESPFTDAKDFTYNGGWTGRYFGLIRTLIKIMIIDSRDELQAAWHAIVAAGGPDAVPEAMAAFNALPFEYHGCGDARAQMDLRRKDVTPLSTVQTSRQWAEFFRQQFTEARILAEASR